MDPTNDGKQVFRNIIRNRFQHENGGEAGNQESQGDDYEIEEEQDEDYGEEDDEVENASRNDSLE